MRLLIIVTVTAFIAAGGLMACNSNETLLSQNPGPPSKSPPPAAATPAPDNARRITAEEAHKLWEKNDVVIIDTRAEAAYKQEHIKGSISMPTGTVLQRIDELPRNKTIVAYCT
jgi:3-mercaptopyruvate sulfurtransferase SseA